jgi:hypothetical protein
MTTERKDGGPAFPSEGEGHGDPKYHSPGMSLRDWFAGQAIGSALACMNPITIEPDANAKLARMAYALADAMLSERQKGGAS